MDEHTTKGQSPPCPYCGDDATYRSRRNGPIEWLLHYLLFRSPYRCQDCNERFFANRLVHHHKKELHHHTA
jgi:transposase-like protein